VADPVGYAETNILGTLNLLQAAKRAGARKFIFASTGGAIYGDPEELPCTERCPAQPLDPYGASKLACEYFLLTYRHNFGLDYCVLRYANVYGPRQNPDGEAGVVAIFARGMLECRPLKIWGDGLQSRDFVYVQDVAAANVAAMHYGSGIYNIGTGLPTDIVTTARELARLTCYTQEIVHGPAKLGEVRHSYLDSQKARRELGWEPQVGLDQGLARTAAWFREDR
jgi:UDP-glucose 4-epimerase